MLFPAWRKGIRVTVGITVLCTAVGYIDVVYFIFKVFYYIKIVLKRHLALYHFISAYSKANNKIRSYCLSDTVDYLEWKTGERAEGICFAMQTLINKVGMAIGAFIGVIAYGMSGISADNPMGSMTSDGLNKMGLMLVLSGVVSFIACIIPMLFYNITEKRQRRMVQEIAERKAAAEAATVTAEA